MCVRLAPCLVIALLLPLSCADVDFSHSVPTPDAQELCLSQHRSDLYELDGILLCDLVADDEVSQYFEPRPDSVIGDFVTSYYRTFRVLDRCDICDTDLVLRSVRNNVTVYETPEKAQGGYAEMRVGWFIDWELLVSESLFPFVKGTYAGACGTGEESCIWFYSEPMLDEYLERMVEHIQVEALFRRANVISSVAVDVYSLAGDVDAARQLAIGIAMISDAKIMSAVSDWGTTHS